MEEAFLRMIHITGGIVWAGAAMLIGFFLLPSLKEAGPAGGAVMGGMVKRGLAQIMTWATIVTLLAGLRIYQLRYSSAWLGTPNGIVLTLGLVLGMAAGISGLFVARPTAGRLSRLNEEIRAAGGLPKAEQVAEIQALNSKLFVANRANAVLLSWTTVLMAASRLSLNFG